MKAGRAAAVTAGCLVLLLVLGGTFMKLRAARWLDAASLRDVRWLPADDGLLPLIEAELQDA